MRRKIIFCLLLVAPLLSHAEEHGGGAAEKKPAGPTSAQEVTELQIRVASLKAKIEGREKEIKKLIEESDHTEDRSKKSEFAQEMVTEQKELEKDTKEYNEALYRLKYQFPERGSSKLSDEKMKEVKTLRELQEQMSLEGRIKKNMKVIRQHYGKKDPKEVDETKEKKPVKEEPQQDPLLKPVIIRK